MNEYFKKTFIAPAVTLLLALPIASLAVLVPPQPNQGAINIPFFLNMILTVVWWVFIAGVVIFFIMIASLFLSSQGNPEEVSKARKALIWGVFGVVVGILAFSILYIIGRAFMFF